MIEVLKQALDAFHQIFESTPVYHNDGTCIINDKSVELSNKAIASLQQAIKDLESQKPVAWMREDGQRVTTASDRHNYPDYETRYSIPLYTHPPQPAQQEWVWLCRPTKHTETGMHQAWQVCSWTEATNHFEKKPNYEYKKFYAPPAAQPAQAKQCNYPDCKCPTENPCLKGLTQPERKQLTDEIPKGVLLAISNAGLTLVKTQHGYTLQKFGPIKAAHDTKERA